MDRLLGPLLMRVAELLDRSLLIVPEVDESAVTSRTSRVSGMTIPAMV